MAVARLVEDKTVVEDVGADVKPFPAQIALEALQVPVSSFDVGIIGGCWLFADAAHGTLGSVIGISGSRDGENRQDSGEVATYVVRLRELWLWLHRNEVTWDDAHSLNFEVLHSIFNIRIKCA